MQRVLAADFETSAAAPSGWPAADGAIGEVAFVGRSNVGKSSLLNALAGRRGLARTSGDPGRTRLVNFFRLEVRGDAGATVALRFVDLPGFGYARVSKAERRTWRPAIEGYLGGRSSLRAAVVLVDARRVPLRREDEADVEEERDLFAWIGARGIAVVPVVTKADKLAKHERPIVAERMRRLAGRPVLLASAVTGEGCDRVWTNLLAALAPPAMVPPP